jgi:glycerol transport system substrate-binding protein
LDSLCAAQEKVLSRIERAGVQGDLGPKLNEEKGADYWLAQPGAPKAKLANEKPQGVTVSYDELVKSWTQ